MKKIIREDTAAFPTTQRTSQSVQMTQAPGQTTQMTQAHGQTTQMTQAPGQPGLMAQEIWIEPTVYLEKKERPTIIRENVLPTEKIEIQPVIHREREQLEVHEVYQPFHERDIAPTILKHETLPAQVRPEWRESDLNFQEKYKAATTKYSSEVHNQPIQREVINRAPIVEEHISKKIIEEVQPVLYRETVKPVFVEETQPIYERVVDAPVMFEETRNLVDLGVKVLPASYTSTTTNPEGVRSTTAQLCEMHLHEPHVHKETLVTKEVYLESVNPKVETKYTT